MKNTIRDHTPIVLDKFKGLWNRGSNDTTPMDHFDDCINIDNVTHNFFKVRPGIGISQSVVSPLADIRRIYNYSTATANTLLILTFDTSTNTGKIYHFINATTLHGPILTKVGMTDFAFVGYAGRAYISPFANFVTGDLNIQKGLQSEFLYVYLGAGVAAQKAAGIAPLTTALTIANGVAGGTDAGFKLFGVVLEYNTGYLSAVGQITSFSTAALSSVSFGNVLTGGATVVKRHLVATKTITSYNGNTTGYTFYFIPNGTIANNIDLFKNNVTFFDADLLEDASHLIDNFSEIAAGAVLSLYHNRLCIGSTFTDISSLYISAEGEPEAIDQVNGLVIVPPDGNPITNTQELRDILYVFKRARTVAYADNGDVPSSWKFTVIDNALGTSVHGIATVLDSGSASVDYLIVCAMSGVLLFNGKYIAPELSWKVEQYWKDLDRNEFRSLQIVNDPINTRLYIVLPMGLILVGNYTAGMDPKNIMWCPWSFAVKINTIAIWNIDNVILGSPILV